MNKEIRDCILANPPNKGEAPMEYYRRIGERTSHKVRLVQKIYRKMVLSGELEFIEAVGVRKPTRPPKFKPIKQPVKTKANVLLLDIETTPIQSFTWDVWKQNVNPIQIIRPWNMLSWAAKWLFDSEILSDVLTPHESRKGDDSRIVRTLWQLMEEADIVIGHNAQKFDIVKINTRFLVHGITQPSPYQVIDTCLVARKKFGFEHNKLDYLAERLGLSRKIETDFQLWIDCVQGEPEALLNMVMYNRQDVLILEEVYVKMRAWIPAHPNMGLFVNAEMGDLICPCCGGTKVDDVGTYSTPVNQYTAFRCADCGAIGRNRNTATSVSKKKTLLHSAAR